MSSLMKEVVARGAGPVSYVYGWVSPAEIWLVALYSV